MTDDRMVVAYDPIYTDGIDPAARFPRERYRRTAEALRSRGGEAWIDLRAPVPCGVEALRAVHDPAYVDAFFAGALDAKARRRIGLRPWTEALPDRTRLLTGGSLLGLHAALDSGGYGGNLAGGTHHAFWDHGGGYCVFNDIAVCVGAARARGIRRVAVLDLDVHQGDGTAAMFAADPGVFTLSIHCGANYPFRKQESDLDVALPADTGDAAYLAALANALPAALASDPELVVFQAGVDGLAADRLGRLRLTRAGLAARNRAVFDAVDARSVPCLVLMGGGYADPIDPTVDALADLYLEAGRRHRRRSG